MIMSSSVPAEVRKVRFIKLARDVHGDRYSYSKVIYTNNHTHVTITCPKHGDFLVKPSHHTSSKSGCKSCYHEGRRKGEAYYIKAAREVHGDLYDYSKVSLTLCNDKVEILCGEHGAFYQTMDAHVRCGNGCPKCAIVASGTNQSHNVEDWISKFRDRHGDEFSYPETFDTTNQYCRVDITCKVHGVFSPTLTAHYSGSKCPECQKAFSMGFRKRVGTGMEERSLYLISFKYEGRVVNKVGVTSDIGRRLKEIHYITSSDISLLASHKSTTDKCLSVELDIKREYKDYRCVFNSNFDGYTECYELCDSQVADLTGKLVAYFN